MSRPGGCPSTGASKITSPRPDTRKVFHKSNPSLRHIITVQLRSLRNKLLKTSISNKLKIIINNNISNLSSILNIALKSNKLATVTDSVNKWWLSPFISPLSGNKMAKGRFRKGLESVISGIGNSVKNARKGILTTAAAIALPFIFVSNVDGSPGKVNIDNAISIDFANGRCRLVHYSGALEGYDSYDHIYSAMYTPSGIASFIVSNIDNRDLDSDARPVDSTSDYTLSLGIISQTGSPINVSSDNNLYISLVDLDESDGKPPFPDENVWITIDGNTYDAKTTTKIPLSRLDGTYPSGTVYNTATVSFTPIINLASIDTLNPTDITPTGATAMFKVLNDGWASGDANWTVYIVYKPHSAPDSDWVSTDGITGSGEGAYSIAISGLPEYTQMDVTCYIVNEAGRVDGDIESFWTTYITVLPSVTTGGSTDLGHNKATLEYLVDSDGSDIADADAQARILFWNEDNPSELYETEWEDVEEGESYYVMLEDLQSDTTYNYLAQIRNATGEADGDTESFRTYPDPNSAPLVFSDPNMILIQNFVPLFQSDLSKPHDKQGLLSLVLKSGNKNTIDANDVLYNTPSGKGSKIVSLVPLKDANDVTIGFYELSKDARPKILDVNDPNSL